MSNAPFAVVTGASSGIGLELARQFVDHGFDVLMTAETAGSRPPPTPWAGRPSGPI